MRAVTFISSGLAIGMLGLGFAAVPLYRVFCQVTGYGGTPNIAAAKAVSAYSATGPGLPMTVRFNADVNSGLPWRFRPLSTQIDTIAGRSELAFYRVTNDSTETVTGTATFNVTPMKAAPYFSKIDCFCFTEQTLKPGETTDMAVSFVIDPELFDDPGVNDVRTITLSYTFFRAPEG